MPRSPDNADHNTDRDFSVSQSKEDIDADIAELFASRPPTVDELFADPIVQMRMATLIMRAVSKPAKPQRREDSR
jgi:hypothetical protein